MANTRSFAVVVILFLLLQFFAPFIGFVNRIRIFFVILMCNLASFFRCSGIFTTNLTEKIKKIWRWIHTTKFDLVFLCTSYVLGLFALDNWTLWG